MGGDCENIFMLLLQLGASLNGRLSFRRGKDELAKHMVTH